MSHRPADTILQACMAVEQGDLMGAAARIRADYPFQPSERDIRRYDEREALSVFARDGFIDRYSGERLIFPAALRLLSQLIPDDFPFQKNWNLAACHPGYYELLPTLDHIVPIARGGLHHPENVVSTSMLRNSAKAHFTIEELSWSVQPAGNLNEWDGLTAWFLRQYHRDPSLHSSNYLRRWAKAAAGDPVLRDGLVNAF